MHRWLSIPALILCLLEPSANAMLPDAPQPQVPASGRQRPQQPGPASRESLPQINQREEDQSDNQDNPAVFSHHLIADRVWVSGQANFIFQAHNPFHSPYSGANSFQSRVEMTALSRVLTLYTGVKLTRWTEFIFNAEEAGGKGLSQALGMAGFVNLDVVRNPSLGQGVYAARYFVHYTIPLTAYRVEEQPNPFYLQSSIPRRRLEFTIGKMSLVDFFDLNSVGSDSHLQFTNWAIDNNGAYDYAANTRGYTVAAMLSYAGPKLEAHYAEALMPTVANGTNLEADLRRARADNLEFEWKPEWFRGYDTHIRPLAYLNHANMGDYGKAIAGYLDGVNKTPDITLYRRQGTLKQGFGLNVEQALPANFRAFLRAGWNEGHHESFAYTEMNSTFAIGFELPGNAWGRSLDQIGSAFETGGISNKHREYLALGGLGFILGDGRLNYGRENVSETYYNAHIVSGLYMAVQLSYVGNPGYNRDRGPVVVPGVRAHVDF
ncbi:MAG TPA: carbohydrate porin [Acidobacteriaceae bacterium]|nr:carbohydrate porin [Acidobacteriaceae bacterium]